MKVMSRILFLMSFSLSAFADDTAFLAVKGKVIQTSQLGEFKEYLIQAPQTIAFSSTLKEESINSFIRDGISVVTNSESAVNVSNCTEAVIVMTVGKGNIIPTLNEIYKSPTIVSFSCINK